MAIIGGWRLKYKKTRPASNPPYHYRRRNGDLSKLGYASYSDYLKSGDWAKIRDDKLAKFPFCLLCQNPASQVHHLDYHERTLLGINRNSLVTLCRTCHERIEFDDDGNKVSMPDANRRLREFAEKRGGLERWLAGHQEPRSDKKHRRKMERREAKKTKK